MLRNQCLDTHMLGSIQCTWYLLLLCDISCRCVDCVNLSGHASSLHMCCPMHGLDGGGGDEPAQAQKHAHHSAAHALHVGHARRVQRVRMRTDPRRTLQRLHHPFHSHTSSDVVLVSLGMFGFLLGFPFVCPLWVSPLGVPFRLLLLFPTRWVNGQRLE